MQGLQRDRVVCYTETDGRFANFDGISDMIPAFFVKREFAAAIGTTIREANMDLSLLAAPLKGKMAARYKDFLSTCGLRDEGDADVIALMTDEDFNIVACGARAGNTLKQFAVSPDYEGEGACATVLTALMNDAMQRGILRLFLCTKPKNRAMFASMGFEPIAATADAVLMENRRNGLEQFLASIPRHDGVCGAVVMNSDPFTKGHLHLLEYAAAHCDALYVFAVSENGSMFSPDERFDMIVNGSAHIKNRFVYRSDAYLVSRATFPAYFIRDEHDVDRVRSDLDIELFRSRIAPALHITKRFVGQEPFSPTTNAYNERMKELLPEKGIELVEIPRLAGISASRVRALIKEGRIEEVGEFVPETTYETIVRHFTANA